MPEIGLLRRLRGLIHRTGYLHQIPTTGALSVQSPPADVIVIELGEDIKDCTAARTGVDWA